MESIAARPYSVAQVLQCRADLLALVDGPMSLAYKAIARLVGPLGLVHTYNTNESTQLRGSVNRWRFQALLGINHNDKPKVFEQVFAGAGINSLSYWLESFFSAGIAPFGLVENSPAVIIGAMLISPLMEPIMATGVALAVGDLYLAIKAPQPCLQRYRIHRLFGFPCLATPVSFSYAGNHCAY
jgi:hypothetical protein